MENDLGEVIKKLAMSSFQASKPTDIMFGDVISTSPLQIKINDKLVLDDDFLVLTNAVKDHYVDMTIDHVTEPTTLDFSHNHSATSSSTSKSTSKSTSSSSTSTSGSLTSSFSNGELHGRLYFPALSSNTGYTEVSMTDIDDEGTSHTRKDNHRHSMDIADRNIYKDGVYITGDVSSRGSFTSKTSTDTDTTTTTTTTTTTNVATTQLVQSHTHEYKGRKKFLIHNGLKTGEKVILIRFEKGQRYLVIDRV